MTAASAHLDFLWQRGRDFLGVEYAVMGGAMSWVSERHLVAAITPKPPALEIEGTQALTRKPFGVNLITMHPQLSELIDVCAKHDVKFVVLAGGLPQSASIAQVKASGAKLMCFAPTPAFGRKLIRLGADALIIEGHEAGGHIGPVTTSVLAQEILPAIRDVPVFVAGGIGRGEAIVSYLEMGAAGVQLGTRFVCATESIAHPAFKKAFIKASARDAMPSVQVDPNFPVIPVRAIVNDASRRFTLFQQEVIQRFKAGELDQKAAQLEIEHFWVGALRKAVMDGDVENGSVMAGQSVGMVEREEPTAAIIHDLVDQANTALKERSPVEAFA